MRYILTEGNRKLVTKRQIIGLSLLVIFLVVASSMSCTKKAEEVEASKEQVTVIKKGMNEFEGVVKVGVGKYFFIPGAQGIDMVVPGQVESGDASVLEGKEVRIRGEFSYEKPSILVVDTIDVKEEDRGWRNIFTKAEDTVVELEDYLDSKARDEFKALRKLDYKKKEDWEGVEKAKVFGKLEVSSIKEGEEEKEIYKIIVLDEKEKEVGIVIVDSITEYAMYYLKKLRLFDKFWFYCNIKDTVDWSIRRKTGEMFHADVVFIGLY